MAVNSYYRDELNYLKEMGRVFAKANPRLSKFLANDPLDPDVERLMEGFAFLVGRLRQRLDAEMPEVALNLLKLVWPHYLRPVPPITNIEFKQAAETSDLSTRVPRGTFVQTRPLEGSAVRFQTRCELKVLPLELTSSDLENRRDSARLTLGFRKLAGKGLQVLGEAPLQVFLGASDDVNLSRQLYLQLMERLSSVEFVPHSGGALRTGIRVEPVGFERSQSTLPYPDGAFDGFRIMQEYFACPDKFMYVRLHGLEAFAGQTVDEFQLVFNFSQRFNNQDRITRDAFSLNTVPAINLFEAEGQALHVAHDRTEYPVRASGSRSLFSVHEVTDVTGWVQGSSRKVDYQAFESFTHDGVSRDEQTLYYRTGIRPSVLGNGVDHYISFVTRLNENGLPPTETVSLKLLCSNGEHAARFGLGTVNQPTSSTPAKLEFRNITPIQTEVPPPLDNQVLWTLIANLSRNYASLIDVEALKTVVGAYDFRAYVDKQAALQRELLLQNFHKFERRSVDIFRQGRPTRAYEIILSLSETAMGGESELFLFGTVLNRFLKSYASINSLHQLTVVGTDANVIHRWSPSSGEAALV
ncbi:type VI secretion system baseplate subunit TssF [Roseibium marinum]|uniref:Type VI secretion system protein ImpG n=1 Tax=Roseibium marinum TaxID=281252 RepID=A0A2S3V1K6_9HYPH|nr:type VI secretion system baseplate subunit TssF [Roseibium marinum]POF33795.1 type VI secretion system protein ImpG [Roseibium marinum]